jgi:hypothetical protein
MQDNYFTLYWIDGKRQVIAGPTIEQAFTAAGYGAGAVKVVDWYDNGISETHYWHKGERKWIKYEPLHIHAQDILSYSEETLVELFHKHHTFIIDFPNKDELVLNHVVGCYATLGWVEHLSLIYGEYQVGNYGDAWGEEDENAHHFMATGGQYFHPSRLNQAVTTTMLRATSQFPYKPAGESERLEDIKIMSAVQF